MSESREMSAAIPNTGSALYSREHPFTVLCYVRGRGAGRYPGICDRRIGRQSWPYFKTSVTPTKEGSAQQSFSVTRIYRLIRLRTREFVLPTRDRSSYQDRRVLQIVKRYHNVTGGIACDRGNGGSRLSNWPIRYRLGGDPRCDL